MNRLEQTTIEWENNVIEIKSLFIMVGLAVFMISFIVIWWSFLDTIFTFSHTIKRLDVIQCSWLDQAMIVMVPFISNLSDKEVEQLIEDVI